MLSLKLRLAGLFGVILLLESSLAAGPALTTIQDILFKADGSRFSGIVQITWNSFQAADTSNVATQSVSTQVNDGFLRVQLVPTTTATTPTTYSVVYNSDGFIQFTETWAVPPSASVLRVADVRVSTAPGSGSAGSTTGGTTTVPVQMSDIAGLISALNIRATIGPGFASSRAAVIDGNGLLGAAAGNLSDCVHVDGTSSACATGTNSGGLPAFADGEAPAGSIDGVNVTFTLAAAPAPASSLALYRNGLVMKQAGDYNISGSTITFLAGSVPQAGDVLLANYRTAGFAAAPCAVYSGAGSPNGLQLGKPCDIYLNTNGGANGTLWVKESGFSTNSGWVSK